MQDVPQILDKKRSNGKVYSQLNLEVDLFLLCMHCIVGYNVHLICIFTHVRGIKACI